MGSLLTIVNAGQDCFAGTAYDISPNSIAINGFSSGGGDISAVAALQPDVDGQGFSIRPAGNESVSLHFDIDPSGMILPDDQATRTLISYGCEPGFGVYHKEGGEWQKINS